MGNVLFGDGKTPIAQFAAKAYDQLRPIDSRGNPTDWAPYVGTQFNKKVGTDLMSSITSLTNTAYYGPKQEIFVNGVNRLDNNLLDLSKQIKKDIQSAAPQIASQVDKLVEKYHIKDLQHNNQIDSEEHEFVNKLYELDFAITNDAIRELWPPSKPSPQS